MGSRTSKVERLIDAYGLVHIGADLEAAWLGEGRERESLRDLADRFNQALVLATARDVGMDIVDGEAENYYRLLTDDGVTAGTRVAVRNRLEKQGIDVASLTDDFVSYQAIRHYLTEVRGAQYDGVDQSATVESEQAVINKLQGRVETVVRDAVERLVTAERLSLGKYRVLVSVDVLCEDCGGQFSVGELLTRRRCDCD